MPCKQPVCDIILKLIRTLPPSSTCDASPASMSNTFRHGSSESSFEMTEPAGPPPITIASNCTKYNNKTSLAWLAGPYRSVDIACQSPHTHRCKYSQRSHLFFVDRPDNHRRRRRSIIKKCKRHQRSDDRDSDSSPYNLALVPPCSSRDPSDHMRESTAASITMMPRRRRVCCVVERDRTVAKQWRVLRCLLLPHDRLSALLSVGSAALLCSVATASE